MQPIIVNYFVAQTVRMFIFWAPGQSAENTPTLFVAQAVRLFIFWAPSQKADHGSEIFRDTSIHIVYLMDTRSKCSL